MGVGVFTYRGPDFPLTSMISIYYLLSRQADEGQITANGIMWTCYSTGPVLSNWVSKLFGSEPCG